MTQSNQTKILIPQEYSELYTPHWRFFAIYGGRASGKSYQVAESLVLRGRQKKMRFLCTRELQTSIKDSVHKLLSDIIQKHDFRDYHVTNDSIRNVITGTEFIFKGLRNNTNEIKSTEGIDVCWVEEAQSVTKASLEILTPTIRKKDSQIIFTFNRFNELDPVYVKFVMNSPPNTYALKVNYDIMEKYGLLEDVTKQEIDDDRANYPDLYAHKWLGEPLSQTEKAIISRNAVLGAMERQVEAEGAVEIGVDVARMGNDRTVFKMRHGWKETDSRTYSHLKTTEVCDRLEQFADWNKDILIKVDDTGVGGGVTDEMEKRGYNVMPMNFGAKASDADKYPNLISEAWFYMQKMMDKIQLENNSDLLMELSTREWNTDSKGRRVVESKDSYKKRGYRSPDLADATILAFYSGNIIDIDDISM